MLCDWLCDRERDCDCDAAMLFFDTDILRLVLPLLTLMLADMLRDGDIHSECDRLSDFDWLADCDRLRLWDVHCECHLLRHRLQRLRDLDLLADFQRLADFDIDRERLALAP